MISGLGYNIKHSVLFTHDKVIVSIFFNGK
jgi:hypothetical protein